MAAALPSFEELLLSCQRTAVHLEMRDGYMRSDPAFIVWQQGKDVDPGKWYAGWSDLLGQVRAHGVQVRRARIVSEPVSDYILFEHSITAAVNVAAGEDVRWLSRRYATDLALPGNDFWLFDDRLVMINHFAGDGEATDTEVIDDADLAKLCSTAFDAVWERAVPHSMYQPKSSA